MRLGRRTLSQALLATERQIQEIIYNFGVHLEYKAAETESSPSSPHAVATFHAVDPQTDVIRLLTEHISSYTATIYHYRDRENHNNNKYHPRNDNDRGNHNNRTTDTSRNIDRDRGTIPASVMVVENVATFEKNAQLLLNLPVQRTAMSPSLFPLPFFLTIFNTTFFGSSTVALVGTFPLLP